MIPRSAQSSLSHWMTTRPGMEAGSSGTTSSSRPAAITMPPECCPRWRGRFWIARPELAGSGGRALRRARSRRPRSPEALGVVVADLAEAPGAELLGEAVDLLRREAEGLAHLARRRAVAVGDDVRGHRRAVRAVASGRRAGSPARAGRPRGGRGRCPATRPRSSERKRSKRRSIFTGSTAVIAARSRRRCWRPSRAPARGSSRAGRTGRCPRRSGNSRRDRASRSGRALSRAAPGPGR